MQAISFELSGRTAFFKKPDVNSYAYFTYNNIHKVVLLGMLGAIIGLEGRIQQYNKLNDKSIKDKEYYKYPEFYNKLKNLKVSILPLADKGYFSKKIQEFNNSVGYASQEQGGNLIVREQWLENPKWNIFILDDGLIDKALFEKLKDYLLNGKCEFIPYLGKNDHFASISNVEIVNMNENTGDNIDSLIRYKNIQLSSSTSSRRINPYVFKEIMPISLNEDLNCYEFEEFILTNYKVLNIAEISSLYRYNNLTLAFF